MRDFCLLGKVAMITGAAGGIGQTIIGYFKHFHVHTLILVDHPNRRETLNAIRKHLSGGCFVETFLQDITNVYEIFNIVDRVTNKYVVNRENKPLCNIDILINAAGVLPDPAPLVKADLQKSGKAMYVNYWGTLNCCTAVLPIMRAQGYGRIVNISSIAAHKGDPGNAIYAASKAAVESLTKSLALEAVYCKEGETPPDITVNAVAPGIVDTPMTANLPDKALQEYFKRSPLKRKIKPEEVAEAVYFLATASPAINGVILPVDGGYLAS